MDNFGLEKKNGESGYLQVMRVRLILLTIGGCIINIASIITTSSHRIKCVFYSRGNFVESLYNVSSDETGCAVLISQVPHMYIIIAYLTAGYVSRLGEELIIRFLNYMEKRRDITGMPNHAGFIAAFQELPSFPFFVVLRGILMKWQLHVFLL
ncbi:hypothetical protein GQX74_010150 [Glossina fuscipes]|nr:hypothetical protein GQX74_010150 [Glossina fuscipes]